MMKDILIKGGRVVHAHGIDQADILIRGEQIFRLGKELAPSPDQEVIDAHEKLVFPGVIDPHTHMGIPIKTGQSADDFVSGSRSALHGGVTSILDFTVLERGQTLEASLEQRIALASQATCDVGLHINVSRFEKALLAEIPGLVAKGFNSFKTFTTYEEAGMMLSYDQIEELARVIAGSDGILMVHSEDNDIIQRASAPHIEHHEIHPRFHGLSRPAQAEAAAISKLGEISQRTGCSIYIVHLNTAEGLAIAANYPRLKLETCPHYLFLDDSYYDRPDGRMYVASPPLRKPADQKALLDGIINGQIHTIGSDHCPFCLDDKSGELLFQDIPNGMGGVETLFPTLLAHFIKEDLPLNLLSKITSQQAAEIFGLGDQKGSLEPGKDADLLIVDPQQDPFVWEKRLDTKVDWNAYSGQAALFPETVFRRGEQVVSHYRLIPTGKGQLLRSGLAR
jgi:dihydropyrimidinase